MAALSADVDWAWWRAWARRDVRASQEITSVHEMATGYLGSRFFRGQATFDPDLAKFLLSREIELTPEQFGLLAAHAFRLQWPRG